MLTGRRKNVPKINAKLFSYWVPCVLACNNLQVLIFPSHQAEVFPYACTVGLQITIMHRVHCCFGLVSCHVISIAYHSSWSISNSSLELVNSVSVMWEKRNLHENRSCLPVTGVRLHHRAKKRDLPTGFLLAGSRRQLTLIPTCDPAGTYDNSCDCDEVDASCECYMHGHALIKGCRR